MAGPSGAGSGGAPKPLSVEQIVQQAQNYDYNPQIPLRYWLHSANTLMKELSVFGLLFSPSARSREEVIMLVGLTAASFEAS